MLTTTTDHSDLDAWTEQIAALDAALTDAAAARATIDAETVTLERLEAGIMLGIEGGNAETRKARLTLALADDAGYETCRQRLAEARQALWDAERRPCTSHARTLPPLARVCGAGRRPGGGVMARFSLVPHHTHNEG